MAIGQKATKASKSVDIDALIEKGGTHPASEVEQSEEAEDAVQKITVRLPKALVKRIDDAIDARPIPISRNQWLAEAAYEMLQDRARD